MPVCKGCGKQIVWGSYLDGENREKRVPLDPAPPVYRVVRHDAGGDALIRRDPDAMVSHFATCPKADQFSGRGRKP